jgi:hypothetical protein
MQNSKGIKGTKSITQKNMLELIDIESGAAIKPSENLLVRLKVACQDTQFDSLA